MKKKCIIVLSEKSSGSTIVQELIASMAQVQYAQYTRHRENETLYWTKAASVLGYPQVSMVASEVPIPPERARFELTDFLKNNLSDISVSVSDKLSLFNYWAALVEKYGPVFVEKSPHHLLQQNVLRLIKECDEYSEDIDFYIVGLIRNPMDVIYSQFQRWGNSPAKIDHQWLQAYQNFELCEELFGDRFKVFRYEDLCRSDVEVEALAEFLQILREAPARKELILNKPSLAKWKRDKYFGYQLSDEAASFSAEYGYTPADFTNRKVKSWPVYKLLHGGYMSSRIQLRDWLVKLKLKSIK